MLVNIISASRINLDVCIIGRLQSPKEHHPSSHRFRPSRADPSRHLLLAAGRRVVAIAIAGVVVSATVRVGIVVPVGTTSIWTPL